MNPDPVKLALPSALAFLKQTESLTAEVKAAMEAVGSNALIQLEASVARQQEICASLCRLSGQMGTEKAKMAGVHAAPFADVSLTHRIRIASASLLALNSQYALLLKHSGDSVRLLAGLCHSYTQHRMGLEPSGGSARAWSCEL
jgi:hypothetical protein